jgi:hypothetical protein
MITIITLIVLGIIGYAWILWYRFRNREKESLKLVTLQVTVPQDNEIKIDAMEQIVGSLSSLHKTAKFKWFNVLIAQPTLSLEIIGTSQTIKFYVSVPDKYQDLVEKQIYSVYNGADVQPVDEPNIYSETGKVEYLWLGLKKNPFYPLKT